MVCITQRLPSETTMGKEITKGAVTPAVEPSRSGRCARRCTMRTKPCKQAANLTVVSHYTY